MTTAGWVAPDLSDEAIRGSDLDRMARYHEALEAAGMRVLPSELRRVPLTVDAQPSNFAWDGERVVLLDTTPPLIWDAGGGPFWDSGNYLKAIPAPLRPAAMHFVRKQGDLSRTSRGVLALTALWMKRIDLPQWVQPAIDTFNPLLDTPITIEETEREYAEVIKRIPNIKRMARIERFWQTRVRRSDYQFFITNSFTGEIL
jgi:hypothetical protein